MKRCPSCSLSNANDADFCIGCGFVLSGITADDREDHRPLAPKAPGYLATGTLVDGKYQIEKILGEGGMGIVYLARDIHTETPVVVKAIRAQFADRPEFRNRTLAEGRALARIDHANVVRLNAVVVEQAALYLVMQFIDGEPLDKMIERHVAARTPIPLEQVLPIFRMILHGVGAAHAEGLIHRDLKPANILIRKRDGVAKVTDFGIAKGEEDAKAGRGVTKGIIGSLAYMAPEQVRGQRDLDKRVDIYALGILLFELLIGRVPFDAPSDYEIMRMHAESPVPNVTALRPEVPRYIDDAVQRACAKDRDARFATTEDFLAALNEPHAPRPVTAPLLVPPVATAPIVAPPIAPPPPSVAPVPIGIGEIEDAAGITGEGASLPPGPRPEPRRRRTAVWLLGASVAIVAAGGSAVYFGTGDDPGTKLVGTGDEGGTKNPTRDAAPEVAAPISPLAALVGKLAKHEQPRLYRGARPRRHARVSHPASLPAPANWLRERRGALSPLGSSRHHERVRGRGSASTVRRSGLRFVFVITTSLRDDGRYSGRSIDLGAGELHQRRPFRHLLGEEGAELLRRAGLGSALKFASAVLASGDLQAVVDRRVELGDDRLRRAVRRHHAGPGVDGEIRIAALDQRRHVRQRRPALAARDRERAQLAVLDLRIRITVRPSMVKWVRPPSRSVTDCAAPL